MKKLFNILMAAVLICSSCAKEVLRPVEIDLGKKTVGVEAGSFPVRVSSDCVWYAESGSSWIEVGQEYHNEEGTFLVTYKSNVSSEGDWRFNRIGYVYVKTYDGATVGTISVWQKGMTPVISFEPDNRIPAEGGFCKVTCMTNLTDSERPRIALVSDQDWISGLKWSLDGRSIEFNAAPGAARSAVITVTHTDEWGIVTEVSCNISQEE